MTSKNSKITLTIDNESIELDELDFECDIEMRSPVDAVATIEVREVTFTFSGTGTWRLDDD